MLLGLRLDPTGQLLAVEIQVSIRHNPCKHAPVVCCGDYMADCPVQALSARHMWRSNAVGSFLPGGTISLHAGVTGCMPLQTLCTTNDRSWVCLLDRLRWSACWMLSKARTGVSISVAWLSK